MPRSSARIRVRNALRDSGVVQNRGAVASGGTRLLYGLHTVAAAWVNPRRDCLRLLVTRSALHTLTPQLGQARSLGLQRPEPELVERADIDRLCLGAIHQGVVLTAKPTRLMELDELCQSRTSSDCVVVLDQVTDPRNAGAVARSSVAFGVKALVQTHRYSSASTAAMSKSASGALEHLPLIRVANLARALRSLRESGFWCIGLDSKANLPLSQIDLTGAVVLVLGAEGGGLRRLTTEYCDQCACLPTTGAIQTLNVSTAAAIALYERVRQLETSV